MSNPVQRKQCRHIRTSGQRCGSAALREQTFCFYHQRTRNRPVASEGVRPQDHTFDLQPTDDRSSIQFAVFEVLRRIALNQIDCKRAGHLLYGLQIAATVLPREPRPTARPTASSTPAPTPDPELIAEYETHPDLGPLAPEADYIPPTPPVTPATPSSILSAEMNRVLASFDPPPTSHSTQPTTSHSTQPTTSHSTQPTTSHSTQPTTSHIPLPGPTLNPTFYRHPASQSYPELQPFLNEARKQAALPPVPPDGSVTHERFNVRSRIEPAEALK